MTSLQAYNSLLTKTNREDTNSNIYVPRGKFVVIYNEQARRWFKSKLKRKLSSDELDELSDLLVDNIEVKRIGRHIDHIDFQLPADYYSLASSFSEASRKGCKKRLTNWKAKPHDIPVLLKDENNNPSFDFEETPLSIAGEKIKVYFTDFNINKVYLNYYRFPKDIDVEGYINLDGSQSTNINPELDNMAVDEIISRCAIEIMRDNEKREGFEYAKERIETEE